MNDLDTIEQALENIPHSESHYVDEVESCTRCRFLAALARVHAAQSQSRPDDLFYDSEPEE